MKRRIHKRIQRERFYLSHTFAAILIGIFAGIAGGEFALLFQMSLHIILFCGICIGVMAGALYSGVMQDIREDHMRRVVPRVGGAR